MSTRGIGNDFLAAASCSLADISTLKALRRFIIVKKTAVALQHLSALSYKVVPRKSDRTRQ